MSTSTCRSLATISSGLCLFLDIGLSSTWPKAIPQGGPLLRGQTTGAGFKPGGEGAAHFFFGEGVEAAVPFCEGEAAIVFGFSCFGFLGSRLPFGIEAPPVA